MPIVIAPMNQELTVIKVLSDDKTKRHLENLGLLVNSKLMVISHSNGDVIVKIKDSKLAINKETALKILVA